MSAPREMSIAAQNTDVEIWRAHPGDYYADSAFVTKDGAIGINAGGFVAVRRPEAWLDLAWPDRRKSLKERSNG